LAILVQDIRESFESSPFFNHMGIEIIHFEEHSVKIKLTIKEHVLNANGTLHGGVHATMLDFIQGMLLRSITKTRCATLNLNTQYLAAISEGDIFAEANVLQLGYKLAFLEGEIKDSFGKILAKGTGTFKVIRGSESI
jgi:uncharacterized protein (TIGR00369 family)